MTSRIYQVAAASRQKDGFWFPAVTWVPGLANLWSARDVRFYSMIDVDICGLKNVAEPLNVALLRNVSASLDDGVGVAPLAVEDEALRPPITGSQRVLSKLPLNQKTKDLTLSR